MRLLKFAALERRALTPLTLGIVALAMAVGRVAAGSVTDSKHSPAIQGPIQLPGAVVVAREPTLAQVLNLVLGEPEEADRVESHASYDPNTDPEVNRVTDALLRHTRDHERARRIAAALVSEGRRQSLGSTLLVGVLLTENPELEPRATSHVGARGLMQVMPFHAGKWGCGSRDLFDIESNICHGVRILAAELRDAGDLSRALLRYNGCVRGTNTPDCRKYARWVYHRAHATAKRESPIPGLTPFASFDRAGL